MSDNWNWDHDEVMRRALAMGVPHRLADDTVPMPLALHERADELGLDGDSVLMIVVLWSLSYDHGHVTNPNIERLERIAQTSRCSTRAVKRTLSKLQAAGLLRLAVAPDDSEGVIYDLDPLRARIPDFAGDAGGAEFAGEHEREPMTDPSEERIADAIAFLNDPSANGESITKTVHDLARIGVLRPTGEWRGGRPVFKVTEFGKLLALQTQLRRRLKDACRAEDDPA